MHTGRSCTCNDPTGNCIMGAVSGGFNPPTQFSSCSVSDFNVLVGRGGDSCLFNTPTTMVGDPVCGNGIREGNEICDCGSAAECTDPCCNAATCQLAAGAECPAGACCNNCQFRSFGTQCRAATQECDIAEYCTGDSNECPEDDHRSNGISCSSNAGYCFDGQCPTLADQCSAAWGEFARIRNSDAIP